MGADAQRTSDDCFRSAVGSSTVMDQSVETEDQQSGIQSETQTQASQDSGAAVRASQNGWLRQATAAGIFMRTDS